MGKMPELGTIEVGQKVVLVRSYNDMRHRAESERCVPAYVIKVARVWLTISTDPDATETNWHNLKMRRDTQNEGGKYPGSEWSFLTLDQHEWQKAQTWALGVLAEQGLTIDRNGSWNGREQELATLLVKA